MPLSQAEFDAIIAAEATSFTSGLDITDINNLYDVLEFKIIGSVQAEFTAGRIKGTDYANVFLAALQMVTDRSINAIQTQEMNKAQIETFVSKRALLDAQTLAVDKDLKTKMAQLLIQWDTQYSASGRDTFANTNETATNPLHLNSAIEAVATALGISLNIKP